jgi:hypothetical protein
MGTYGVCGFSSALEGLLLVQWNSSSVSGHCTMLDDEPYIFKYYLSVYMHINHNAVNNAPLATCE